MSNNNKMDTSEVFAMFETINSKLDKQSNKLVEPTQVDLLAISTMTEQFENLMKEVWKPTKVEHHHCHRIDIRSNWFFFSWVALVIVIFVLFWAIANQRQTISQYRDNDLKYRYIKMQGQADKENLYRLEQQFKYSDSIKIISKQVERYEELIHEQKERIDRIRENSNKMNELQLKVDKLKRNK